MQRWRMHYCNAKHNDAVFFSILMRGNIKEIILKTSKQNCYFWEQAKLLLLWASKITVM